MVKPLDNDNITSVYGRFSFIPTAGTPRLVYFFYEYMADFMRWVNKRFREEAVNVYGFNSGFKREQGLQVDGFNHPVGANEDGWLALKLREKGFGKLYYVTNIKALVWTNDRRIQYGWRIVERVYKTRKTNRYKKAEELTQQRICKNAKNIECRAGIMNDELYAVILTRSTFEIQHSMVQYLFLLHIYFHPRPVSMVCAAPRKHQPCRNTAANYLLPGKDKNY